MRLRLVIFAERAEPDVAKADGVPVLVKFDGAGFLPLVVVPDRAMAGIADEFSPAMHDHAVVQDRGVRFPGELAVGVPARTLEPVRIDFAND